MFQIDVFDSLKLQAPELPFHTHGYPEVNNSVCWLSA